LFKTCSDMTFVTPACFWFVHAWYIFFHLFTFSLCVSLVVRYVSSRQQIIESCFLIQSVWIFWLES
jgi:hypothetical protein